MKTEDKSGLLAWFAGNSVAANLLMIALVLWGVFMGFCRKVFVFRRVT